MKKTFQIACLIVALAFPAQSLLGQCEALFYYEALGADSVVFYNASQNMDEAEWDFGDGVTLSSTESSFTYTFDVSGVFVCLNIWNAEGCQDEYCRYVDLDNPVDLCEQTDCVWPGDANGDGKANIYDLLNIGLGFGAAGVERPVFPEPDNPIAWAPNVGIDWDSWVGPVNYKHLDCNGNGLVSEEDVQAIRENYIPDPEYTSIPVEEAPPVYLVFDSPVIVIDEFSPESIDVQAHLFLGNGEFPVEDLHGIAFYLNYPDDLMDAGQVTVDYHEDSFLGPQAEVLALEKDLGDQIPGRFDYALSRKAGAGVNGLGKVATFSLVVNSDIIDGRAEPEIPFSLSIGGIRMIDAGGNELSYSLGPDSVTVIILNGGTSGLEDSGALTGWQVFPNPARDLLGVSLDLEGARKLALTDLTGRTLLERPVTDKQVQMMIGHLDRGLYLLRLYTSKGVLSRKIVLQ